MARKKEAEQEVAEGSTKRASALDVAISSLKQKFGDSAVNWLSEAQTGPLEIISTGSLVLDAALGVGGVARGRFYELYGPPSSGKSTVAYSIISQAQKRGLKSVYIDAEWTLDRRLVEKMGAHSEDIILVQGHTGEDNLDIAEALMATGEVAICVVDSISALQPAAEANLGSFSDNTMGVHPRLMARMCRTFTPLAGRTKTTLILINQIRSNIGGYGNPETTSGGNAIRHQYTGRIRISGGGVKSTQIAGPTGKVIGHRVSVEVTKNKLAAPWSTGEVDLIYGVGFDTYGELLDLGVDMGFVEQRGSWFSFGEERLGQGRANSLTYLMEHPETQARLRLEITKLLGLVPAANE